MQPAPVPIGVALHAVVPGVPVMLGTQMIMLGTGVAIPIRSETVKGAGQMFGVVFGVIFFGGGYGLPTLIAFTPLRQPTITLGKYLLEMPFAAQYAAVVLLLALPAGVVLVIVRVLFDRERMLT